MSDTKRTITPNDPADFTPTREPQIPLQPFRYWCQKVLPLVYDDSLSYYELLCKVVDYLNKTMEDVTNMDTDMTNLYNAYNELQSYVNSYFSTLDVQEEINNKLDVMATDGTLSNIILPQVSAISQPIVVESTTEMIMQNRTYVLKSNGHIYQYKSGTGWVDTGLVYSTDIQNYFGSMSSTPTDLNAILSSGFYFHSSSAPDVINTPNDAKYGSEGFMVLAFYNNAFNNYQIFMPYQSNEMMIRHQINDSNEWEPWASVLTNVKGLPNLDLNKINQTGCFSKSSSVTGVLNTPNDPYYDTRGFELICYYLDSYNNYQMLLDYTENAVYIRHQMGETWTKWSAIPVVGEKLYTTDLNNVQNTGAYFHASSDEPVTNSPDDNLYGNEGFLLLSYTTDNREYNNYQLFMAYMDNSMFIRHRQGPTTWTNWTRFSNDSVAISKYGGSDNDYLINIGSYTVHLKHDVNTAINSDLWNLTDIRQNDTVIVPVGTDIIGPIKEVGESDFMGGVHGDEKTTQLAIFTDGKMWDKTTPVNCEQIDIVMISEIYRVSSKEHIYNRHVHITITHNKITIESLYTCLVDDSTIERATNGGLVAVRNDVMTGAESNNFFINGDLTKSPNNKSKNNITGRFYLNNGEITLNNIIGHEKDTYIGYLECFTTETPIRNKFYFDVISSAKKINNGENIQGKFELIFK